MITIFLIKKGAGQIDGYNLFFNILKRADIHFGIIDFGVITRVEVSEINCWIENINLAS